MSDPREPVALDPTKLVEATASDPGKVRTENQDALSAQKNVAGERLFVISDGMGGQRGGETAAKLCIETLSRAFRDPHGAPEERLRRGLELANEEVYSHALSQPELKGMGTTAVALLFSIGTRGAWLAWIGASRCYRLRGGTLEKLTRDHSLMAEWVEMGVIRPEEVENHPRRGEPTPAIGQAPDVAVEAVRVDLQPGDRFMLCSHGIHVPVPERSLKAALAGHRQRRLRCSGRIWGSSRTPSLTRAPRSAPRSPSSRRRAAPRTGLPRWMARRHRCRRCSRHRSRVWSPRLPRLPAPRRRSRTS